MCVCVFSLTRIFVYGAKFTQAIFNCSIWTGVIHQTRKIEREKNVVIPTHAQPPDSCITNKWMFDKVSLKFNRWALLSLSRCSSQSISQSTHSDTFRALLTRFVHVLRFDCFCSLLILRLKQFSSDTSKRWKSISSPVSRYKRSWHYQTVDYFIFYSCSVQTFWFEIFELFPVQIFISEFFL